MNSEPTAHRDDFTTTERLQRGLTELRELIAIAEDDVLAKCVGTFDRQDIKRELRERFVALRDSDT